MPTPNTGDRVRVILEGKYVDNWSGLGVKVAGRTASYVADEALISVEILEPAYVVGGIYRSAAGTLYQRTSLGDWRYIRFDGSNAGVYPDAQPERPLELVVQATN